MAVLPPQDPPPPADPDPTEQLAARARAGDRAALEALLQQHLPGLEAFVRLRVGRAFLPREGASDVVQSACRDAVLGMHGFRYGGEEGFRKWLFAIAARKVADKFEFHRAQRRDIGREVGATGPYAGTSEAASAIISRLSAVTAGPVEAAEGAEMLQQLEAAMDALEPDERDVVLLSRVAQLSRAEVAAAMGRSEASVRNLLHRTLVKLSQRIVR